MRLNRAKAPIANNLIADVTNVRLKEDRFAIAIHLKSLRTRTTGDDYGLALSRNY